MKKIISLLIVIGAIIALITFGYIAGYKIGCAIGKDLTQTVEQNGRLLDN